MSRKAFLLHQRSHVLRRVVLTGDPGKITTGGDAVVVVVAVRDQHGVQPGHVGGGDRELDHHRHVETAQQGIDHQCRAATVDQEPGHAQPPQEGPIAGLQGFRAERLCLWVLELAAAWLEPTAKGTMPVTPTEIGAPSVGVCAITSTRDVLASPFVPFRHWAFFWLWLGVVIASIGSWGGRPARSGCS